MAEQVVVAIDTDDGVVAAADLVVGEPLGSIGVARIALAQGEQAEAHGRVRHDGVTLVKLDADARLVVEQAVVVPAKAGLEQEIVEDDAHHHQRQEQHRDGMNPDRHLNAAAAIHRRRSGDGSEALPARPGKWPRARPESCWSPASRGRAPRPGERAAAAPPARAGAAATPLTARVTGTTKRWLPLAVTVTLAVSVSPSRAGMVATSGGWWPRGR